MKKPKFSDMIHNVLALKNAKDAKVRNEIKMKIAKQFENKIAMAQNDDDMKFHKVVGQIGRMIKVLTF